jgi:hypothetical protein
MTGIMSWPHSGPARVTNGARPGLCAVMDCPAGSIFRGGNPPCVFDSFFDNPVFGGKEPLAINQPFDTDTQRFVALPFKRIEQ